LAHHTRVWGLILFGLSTVIACDLAILFALETQWFLFGLCLAIILLLVSLIVWTSRRDFERRGR
jgi:uncharacterized iron-regulated membrane protein